jgi:peroxiredoxin
MISIGDTIEDFALPGLDGQTYRLSDYRGQVVIVNFWSAACPWSQKYDPYFQERWQVWQHQGIALLAVASNADEGQEDLRRAAAEAGLTFPILLDKGNAIADRFDAVTTPHVYVIDSTGRLVYRGSVDNRQFRKEPTAYYLDDTLASVRQGRTPALQETSPRGCTIVRAFEEA